VAVVLRRLVDQERLTVRAQRAICAGSGTLSSGTMPTISRLDASISTRRRFRVIHRDKELAVG
jgi:hypothetical protein